MTDKELKRIEKEKHISKYDSKELSCRSMINSIICYGGFGKSAKQILEDEKKAYHNYLEDYIDSLGEEKVLELIQEQLNDIVDIEVGTYTDHEGCTYNSIVWRDEI